MNEFKQKDQMNKLCDDLMQDIRDVRGGDLSLKKASAISRLSSSAINSIAKVSVTMNHQRIQDEKIALRAREVALKESKEY